MNLSPDAVFLDDAEFNALPESKTYVREPVVGKRWRSANPDGTWFMGEYEVGSFPDSFSVVWRKIFLSEQKGASP